MKQWSHTRIVRTLGPVALRCIRSIWLFPSVLGIILIILTALQISGSSIGVYDQLLGGDLETPLVSGSPQTVRTDEWIVTTPLTLSQAENNFAPLNPDIGRGQDVTAVSDVPYRDWSTIFRPQNLAFFVLPATFAFAFKWWFIGLVLMVAVYSFVLYILPGKRLLAALLAVGAFWNPFVQWWYVSGTLLSIGYTLAIVTLALLILQAQTARRRLLLSGALGYVAVCFALLLYPAFQIPCALVGAAAAIALYLARYTPRTILQNWRWAWIVTPIVIALSVVGLFLFQHRGTIEAISNTVYPGGRIVEAGGTAPELLLQWPLTYLLPSGNGSALGDNQSEASNFLLFGMLLVPLLVYTLFVHRRSRPDNTQARYLCIAALTVSGFFLLRMFMPIGDGLYAIVQLSSTPHIRLLIGIGLVNLLLLIVAFMLPTRSYTGRSSLVDYRALAMGAITCLVVGGSLFWIRHQYDLPTVGRYELLVLTATITGAITALAHRIQTVRYIGLGAIVIFGIIASWSVNPLYRGFGSLTKSPLAQGIADITDRDPTGFWIVSDKLAFESIPVAQGAPTLSGVYLYPQLDLWKQYFPDNERTYNRYAHAIFIVDDAAETRSMRLLQGDAFTVTVHSCDPFLRDLRVRYIMTVAETDTLQCFETYRTYDINGTSVDILKRK